MPAEGNALSRAAASFSLLERQSGPG
jgi:hypothetical protein